MYKPQDIFNVALVLLKPTTVNVNGSRKKVIPDISQGTLFYGSFKTYGGTERDINGVYSIDDTADVETWYNPEITSDCIIAVAETGAQYEILGVPENISMRNQFMKFKLQRAKGGV